MIPTQHFGDLHIAFGQFASVGLGETFRSKGAPVAHHGQQPVPAQLQANEQVEDADNQHGEQEEDECGNQDD